MGLRVEELDLRDRTYGLGLSKGCRRRVKRLGFRVLDAWMRVSDSWAHDTQCVLHFFGVATSEILPSVVVYLSSEVV